jgi:hypothetical protein
VESFEDGVEEKQTPLKQEEDTEDREVEIL